MGGDVLGEGGACEGSAVLAMVVDVVYAVELVEEVEVEVEVVVVVICWDWGCRGDCVRLCAASEVGNGQQQPQCWWCWFC